MAEPPENRKSQPPKADREDVTVEPVNCHVLRMQFAALKHKEKYEALLTLLEQTDQQDFYRITLSEEEEATLMKEKDLDQFVKLLESSPPEILLKFTKSMKLKGNLVENEDHQPKAQPFAPSAATTEAENFNIDPDVVMIPDLNQAERFRLGALVFEQENTDVAFTSSLIVRRVEEQWALSQDIPEDEGFELPVGMKFTNHSKTASDLEKSNELQCVDRVSRDKTYRLTRLGIERARQLAADQQ